MKPRRPLLALAALCGIASCRAQAGDIDLSKLYEISTEGTTRKLKAGEAGKVVIEIRTKPGAHVSEDAPLRIELTGRELNPEKQKLTLKDSVGEKAPGQEHPNPRFEVPFTAKGASQGSVEAKMTFFLCTEKLCVRQQKQLSLPVEVL